VSNQALCDSTIGSMERLFVAGLCGLAYGLADVVDVFRSHGGIHKKKGRLRCHKRPKSREETP
jgi:hypothetical protein